MDVLTRLQDELPEMPRKLANSARYAIDNPDKIALQSMRSSATAAGVTSTTMLRLARHLGFEGYDDFRSGFQELLVRNGFGSRAQELQLEHLRSKDRTLEHQIFDAAVENLEKTRSALSSSALIDAAKTIREARGVYLIGTGSAYVISMLMKTTGTMALPNLRLVGSEFGTAPEGMDWLNAEDAAIGIGVNPYATRTVEGLAFANSVGAKTIVITDRPSSPMVKFGTYCFYCGVESPHYFPSAIAQVAMVEALLAAAVAQGSGMEVRQVDRIERNRYTSDAYIAAGR